MQKHPLILKFMLRDKLTAEEVTLLESIAVNERTVRSGEMFVRQDEELTESTLLLDGFAARVALLPSGRRQITALHVAGDFVDLHSFVLKRIDDGIEALTACRIANVRHTDLTRITENHPHLTRLLWMSTVIDAAIHRAWLVAIGRLQGNARVAHLLCEMFLRLQTAGRTQGQTFVLPLTQATLGEALGFTDVHINRSIQELRRSALVTWEGKTVTINDWDGLTDLAEFDPVYLSLQQRER